MAEFLGILLRSLEYGSIYALAALSVVLVYRTSYTTNFALGVLGMFSSYLVASLILHQGLALPLALLCGIALAFALGFAIDIVVIRPAAKVSPVGKQIITLGVLSIILGVAPLVYGVYDLRMPKFIPQGQWRIGAASLSYNGLLDIALGLIVMAALFYVLQKTKAGLAIRATAENAAVARLMGISSKKVTMLSWGVAGALATLAGVMAAPFSSVSLFFMNDVQVTAFMACLLGGFSTFYGAVIGAYILAVSSNILQVYLPGGTVWGKSILYALLITFLFFKPYGLFGKKIVKKV